MKRGIFDIVLVLLLFILPYWVGIILMFVGIFLFKNFYEFIISGTILYSLYTIPGNNLITSPILFFTIVIIIYIFIQILRHKIIFYNRI